MTPWDQHRIQWIYQSQVTSIFINLTLNALKYRLGVYINEGSLRYTLLTLSARDQRNYQEHEPYQSMFWPAVGQTSRSIVSIDHLIAFTIMMVAVSSDSLYERLDYLWEVANIMIDIANGCASIDFLASGIEFELFIHAFRCVERMIPINDLDYQRLALSHFKLIEPTFPQLCKLLHNPGKG